MTTKKCARCGLHQPLTEYYADFRAPDHKVSSCKGCYKAQREAKRAAMPVRERPTQAQHAKSYNIEAMMAEVRRNLQYAHGCRVHEADRWKHTMYLQNTLGLLDDIRKAKHALAGMVEAEQLDVKQLDASQTP